MCGPKKSQQPAPQPTSPPPAADHREKNSRGSVAAAARCIHKGDPLFGKPSSAWEKKKGRGEEGKTAKHTHNLLEDLAEQGGENASAKDGVVVVGLLLPSKIGAHLRIHFVQPHPKQGLV